MISCGLLTTSAWSQSAQDKSSKQHPIPIVDCHVHLWDLSRPAGIYWIPKDNKTLYRSFLPQDYAAIAKANGVQGAVVVQAGQSLPDNQWYLDLTADCPELYRGVVGNLSEVIGTEKFRPLFEKLCQDKRYVGYRLSGRYQDELTAAFYRDLKLTAERGKTVDFLVGDYTFEDINKIAKRLPELKIMLDHFGKVQLNGQALDPTWIKGMREVSRHKNVYCKVSALYGRVKEQPAPQDIQFYRPVLDLSLELFGEDRLVYGSDWPVTETTGDYASVLKLTKAYFDDQDRRVQEKLYYQNAIKFYGIPKFD